MRKVFVSISLLFLLSSTCLLPAAAAAAAPSPKYTFDNQTNQKIYIALYEQTSSELYTRKQINIDALDTVPTLGLEQQARREILRPRSQNLVIFAAFADGILAGTVEQKIVAALPAASFAQRPFDPATRTYTITLLNDRLTFAPIETAAPSYISQFTSWAASALASTWGGVAHVAGASTEVLKTALRASFADYPHRNEQARVQPKPDDSEIRYLAQRIRSQVKPTLATITGDVLTDETTPRIALCCTGGGTRAMLGTLGVLRGAEQWQQAAGPAAPINFMNAVSTILGLSGSTWAMSVWIHSQKSADACITDIGAKLTKPMEDLSDTNIAQLAAAILKPYAFDEPTSLIDIYGALLAQRFLRGIAHNPNALTIPEQAEIVSKRGMPFPLYTAIVQRNTEGEQKQHGYVWCEVSPFQTRLVNLLTQNPLTVTHLQPYITAAIPTWAFGRTFNNGVSTNTTPPPATGCIMGVCGSAFSVNIKEAYGKIAHTLPNVLTAALHQQFPAIPQPIIGVAVEHIFKQYSASVTQFLTQHRAVTERRAFPAQVPNWLYNNRLYEFHDAKFLTLLDAGIDFNFPLPSALLPDRAINIIIMVDLGPNNKRDLAHAERYARSHGLKFPRLGENHLDILEKEHCSVFQDPADPSIPTVIYLQPLKAHPSYLGGRDLLREVFTQTDNFVYTAEQVNLLTGLATHTVRESKEKIVAAVKQWIDMKKKVRGHAAAAR